MQFLMLKKLQLEQQLRRHTMFKCSISEIVHAALKNTETIIQPDSITFDPRKHVELDRLPAIASPAIQYLHCAEITARLNRQKCSEDFERIKNKPHKGAEQQAGILTVGTKLVSLSNLEDTLLGLKTGLILEEHPLGFRYKGGVIIVEGWRIVGRLKSAVGEAIADLSDAMDNYVPGPDGPVRIS